MDKTDLKLIDAAISDAIYLSLLHDGYCQVPKIGSFIKDENGLSFTADPNLGAPKKRRFEIKDADFETETMVKELLKAAVDSHAHSVSILPDRALIKVGVDHQLGLNLTPALSELLILSSRNITTLAHKGEIYEIASSFYPADRPVVVTLYIEHKEPPNFQILPWQLPGLKRFVQNPLPLTFISGRDFAARQSMAFSLTSLLKPKFGQIFKVDADPDEALLDGSTRPETVWYFARPISFGQAPFLKALAKDSRIILAESKLLPIGPFASLPNFHAQLSQRLCSKCKTREHLISKKTVDAVKKVTAADLDGIALREPAVFKSVGCSACDYTGFKNHLLLFSPPDNSKTLSQVLTLALLSGEISEQELA